MELGRAVRLKWIARDQSESKILSHVAREAKFVFTTWAMVMAQVHTGSWVAFGRTTESGKLVIPNLDTTLTVEIALLQVDRGAILRDRRSYSMQVGHSNISADQSLAKRNGNQTGNKDKPQKDFFHRTLRIRWRQICLANAAPFGANHVLMLDLCTGGGSRLTGRGFTGSIRSLSPMYLIQVSILYPNRL